MATEPEIATGIAANRTRANHRPLRPPPASCHFRVVVAGARGGVLEVKVIELIPFTADRLNPHWSSSRRQHSVRPGPGAAGKGVRPLRALKAEQLRAEKKAHDATDEAHAFAVVWTLRKSSPTNARPGKASPHSRATGVDEAPHQPLAAVETVERQASHMRSASPLRRAISIPMRQNEVLHDSPL